MKKNLLALLPVGALVATACAAPDSVAPVSAATSSATVTIKDLDPADDGTNPDIARVARLADRVNARLEKSGSKYRIDGATFFMVGRGTDGYRRLRTGARWNDPNVTYVIDESDVIAAGPVGGAGTKANTINAINASWQSWNVLGTTLKLTRVADPGTNIDVLDGIIKDRTGACVDIVDLKSPVVTSYDPKTGEIGLNPVADNVFGGWLAPDYFKDCLGSQNIIGVTWSFSDVDSDGDQYRDRVYTEMYYNTRFQWVTEGSPFLSSIMDVSSIVTHEAGHAHGLGHFGGPNANEPFKLQPNGSVFDPEASMNPFYIGGQSKRFPLSTDVAALTTLYQQNNQ